MSCVTLFCTGWLGYNLVVAVTCCSELFYLALVASVAVSLSEALFLACRLAAYIPFRKIVTEGIHVISYRYLAANFTGISCISLFCTGRLGYDHVMTLARCLDFFNFALVASVAVSLSEALFLACRLAGYIPVGKIVTKSFHIIINSNLAANFTGIDCITLICTGRLGYDHIVLMTAYERINFTYFTTAAIALFPSVSAAGRLYHRIPITKFVSEGRCDLRFGCTADLAFSCFFSFTRTGGLDVYVPIAELMT